MSKAYDEIAKELSKARRVLFVTGAGISADSGLPTYRGVGGLYNGDGGIALDRGDGLRVWFDGDTGVPRSFSPRAAGV